MLVQALLRSSRVGLRSLSRCSSRWSAAAPPTLRPRGAFPSPCAPPPVKARFAARRQRGAATCVGMAHAEAEHLFGPYPIRSSEVFVDTPLSLALVNLKPVVPGHVLIIPRRVVPRFQDLTPEELTDMWALAQRVGPTLERHFQAASLTMAIQDGPAAGQTVAHVHIHILPRKFGDFENNDEVYDKIDEHAEQMKEKLDLDKERVVRTPDEMAAEAAELRALFV